VPPRLSLDSHTLIPASSALQLIGPAFHWELIVTDIDFFPVVPTLSVAVTVNEKFPVRVACRSATRRS